MKKILLACLLLFFITLTLHAQDEGAAVAQQRFENDKGIYIAAGPAFALGKNLGDYSTGLSFEVGFLKRLNKVMSIGPNISYLAFKYDADKTYPYYYEAANDDAIELELTGGDVAILSAGFTLKLNFVPVGDNTKVSIYGIGTPFVSYSTRSELSGAGYFYEDFDFDGVYDDPNPNSNLFPDEWDASAFPVLEKESKVSGGLHVGFGADFVPTKAVAFFIQATFSYTLPITYVSTEDYLKDATKYEDENSTIYYEAGPTYYDEEFPVVKNGFSALSIKAGVSFNF